MEAVKNVARSAKEALTHSKSDGRSQELILITGGTGFVAAHVLHSFLSRGYHVRTTVRSQAKAKQVEESHRRYKPRLSFAIVPDITIAGAFDEAVKGVSGVVHTASPVLFDTDDNERDVLNPAIRGTTGILESVKAHAPQVKRVVVTSSFASLLNASQGDWPDHTYSEADWNPVTLEEGKTAGGGTTYAASKTFAEKAAFDFVREQKPNFNVTALCPPMVFGPLAHSTDISNVNHSSGEIWRYLDGSMKDEAGPGETFIAAFVDARDLGEAHVKAYERKTDSDERFFVTSSTFLYNDVCAILKKAYKGTELEANIPDPEGTRRAQKWKVDNSKARKELGVQFMSLEKSVTDTARSLLQLKEAAKTGKKPEYVSEEWP